MSARTDYWVECLQSAFDEHGVVATAEQIKLVAMDVEGGHENMSMAFPAPDSPYPGEIERLGVVLARLEKDGDLTITETSDGRWLREAAAEITALRERVAQLEGGWLPINEAKPPKDKCLFFHPKTYRHSQLSLGEWIRAGYYHDTPNRLPTHYWRIPTPPKEAGK